MKKLFNLLTLTIIIILVILVFLFYFGVFNPLRSELEQAAIENFKNTVSITEINIENFLDRCIEGTESLSSRTMIKNKLILYRNNKIGLQEIRDYTETKYIDGTKVLDNIIKALRVSDNEKIAEFECEKIDSVNLKKYRTDRSETTVELIMKDNIIVVNSPIMHHDDKIGQDIVAFQMNSLLADLYKQNINYNIVLEKDINNNIKDDHKKVFEHRKLLDTKYFLKVSITKDRLNKELQSLLTKIIIGIILIIIILVYIFRVIINKTYNKVIEKLNKKIDRITELSETDIMLGINNRTKFMNELENELYRSQRYNKKLSMIMFDVDNFKEINDEYGHYVGDEVLFNITELVNEIIRESDIFARYGGDEFIILLPETNVKEAANLAKRLKEKIEVNNFNSVDEAITCSFGVTEYINKENIDDFIKRVDDALYVAKNLGRNRVEKL